MLIQLNTAGGTRRDYVVVPRRVRRFGRDIMVPVEEYDVELFTDSFDTLGGQSQERIGPYTSWIAPNFMLGFGRDRTASDSFRNPNEKRRFIDSHCDTRFIDARLPIRSEPTIQGGLEVLRAMVDFKSDVHGFWEDTTSADLVVRTLTGSTLTWDGGGAVITGATSVALDIIAHKTHLVVLYASTNDHITERSTDGITWSAAATPLGLNRLSNSVTAHEDIDAGLLAEIGGEIIAILWDEGNGTIVFESDPDVADTWAVESLTIASGNGPQGVAVMAGIDNEDKLLICLREGLWEIDTAPATWTSRLIFPMTASNDNGRRMTIHSDGALWFSQGVGDDSVPITYRMFTSDGERRFEIVPNDLSDGDGVVTEMLGPIRAMYSSGGFLYASMGGGKAARQARIIAHNSGGWHSMHRHVVADQQIEPIFVTGEDDGTPRLLFGIRTATDTTEVKFLGQPDANPQSGVSINREDDGFIDLPRIDGGMPLINAAWLRFGINASSLSADNTGEFIQVKYGLNGASRTTSPSTAFEFTSGTLTKDLPDGSNAGAGETARNIGIRVTLNRDNTAVAFDAVSSGSESSSTGLTVSHTTGSGSNRALIVGVSIQDTTEADTIPTGVTYNGVAMTKGASETKAAASGNMGVSIWYLKAPATGANDVVVSVTGTVSGLVVGAVSVTGARQDPPIGSALVLSGTGTSASLTLLSGPDDLVMDVLALDSGAVSQAATVGASQTQRWNIDEGTMFGAGSTEPGADGTTTMSWSSFSNSKPFFLMAAVINAVGDTNTPELEDVEINYLKIPPTLEGYIFTVDVKATADKQGVSANPEVIVTQLKVLRDLGTLPILVYGPSGNRFVRIRDVRWFPELNDGSASGSTAPDALAKRAGYMEVRAEEVV